MAGVLYKDLDNTKEQIRILRLHPRNTAKDIEANVQIVKAQDMPQSGGYVSNTWSKPLTKIL
jgi:hypothetical protein